MLQSSATELSSFALSTDSMTLPVQREWQLLTQLVGKHFAREETRLSAMAYLQVNRATALASAQP